MCVLENDIKNGVHLEKNVFCVRACTLSTQTIRSWNVCTYKSDNVNHHTVSS